MARDKWFAHIVTSNPLEGPMLYIQDIKTLGIEIIELASVEDVKKAITDHAITRVMIASSDFNRHPYVVGEPRQPVRGKRQPTKLDDKIIGRLFKAQRAA